MMFRLKIIRSFLIAGIFFLSHQLIAQKENVFLHPDKFYKKYFPKLKIKRVSPDTSYIKSYPKYLSIGAHVLSPTIFLNINSDNSNTDGQNVSSKWRTNVSDILGFSIGYRFINIGFAFLIKSASSSKNDFASTSYRTITFKYNNPVYYLQYKFSKIKGLTDVNTANSLNPIIKYIKRDDIFIKEHQFEGLYNFHWRKYSYLAPLNFSQRQLKSRAGILLKAGAYYNELTANADLVSLRQRPFYGEFSSIQKIRSVSLKLAPGIGGNLVILKRIYFSAVIFTAYDLYFYKYYKFNQIETRSGQSFMLVLDTKASLGYQSKRFYAGIRYEGDKSGARLKSITMNTLNSFIGLETGYRFDAPKIVRKIYRKTMPPGM